MSNLANIEIPEENIVEYSVYARPDENDKVIKIFSTYFEEPLETDVLIKTGSGEEYIHVGYYEILTSLGAHRYKIVDGALTECTEDEITIEIEICKETYSGELNELESISGGRLTAVGWHRIAKYPGGEGSAFANSCEFSIKRTYENVENEYHNLRLVSVSSLYEFQPITSKSKVQLFDKVRYTYDENNGYIEVYYSGTVQEAVHISVTKARDYNYRWTAMVPESTEETVEGVTVVCSYDIKEVSPVTSVEVDELKKSVSDGKAEVAGAITEMGVETAADATFKTMADNILSIQAGIEAESIGSTGKEVYVYKDTTINAGDFIKFTEGVAYIEKGEGCAESQTHTLSTYSRHSSHSYQTGPGSSKLKRLDDNTVLFIRGYGNNVGSNANINKIYICVGVIENSSIKWGTEFAISHTNTVAASYGFDACSLGDGKFVVISPQGNSYKYIINVYSYSGTVVTLLYSITNITNPTGNSVPYIYGLTYLGNNKVFMLTGYTYANITDTGSSTFYYRYGVILTFTETGCSFGTFESMTHSSSSVAANSYPINIGNNIYFSIDSAGNINTASSNAMMVRINDTLITYKSIRCSFTKGYYYNTDRDILVGVSASNPSYTDGIFSLTLTITESSISNTALTLTVNNTYVLQVQIPTAININTGYYQNHMNTEMPGMYLGFERGYFYLGSYNRDNVHLPMSIILKYTESGYELVALKDYFKDTSSIAAISYEHIIDKVAALNQNRVVTGFDRVVGYRQSTYSTPAIIETVVEGISTEGFNFETVVYEEQIIKAETNDDIKGIAVTSGVGGTDTLHNEKVTVRQNI